MYVHVILVKFEHKLIVTVQAIDVHLYASVILVVKLVMVKNWVMVTPFAGP